MIRSVIYLFLLIFISKEASFAQEYPRKNYNWDENRKTAYVPTADEKQASAVVILDSRYYDYAESPDTARGFDMFVTRHKIVHVNDDKGIDRFNKVYIQMEKGDELVQLKARTINKDGKIIEVNKDNIKDVSNMEEYGNYKIFALEGVEKDAELEYFYTVRKTADIYGSDIFQTDLKVKEANWTLTTPSFLEFETKSYNGFPTVTQESKDSVLTIMHTSAKEIPAMVEEEYSTSEANRMKIVYKLSHNRRVSDEKYVTWNTAAKRYYNIFFPEDLKIPKLNSLIKGLKLSKLDQEDQVRAVEKFIKNTIGYKKASTTELANPNIVLEQKLGNEVGLTRLYGAIFKELEIPVYLVLTSNRFESKFDPDFVDYDNFSEVVLYFPAYQKYLSPSRIEYRYGPAPINVADNYGLFIKGLYSGVTKFIPVLGVDDNKILLDAELTFNDDMDAVIVNKKLQWTGYRAYNIRGVYEYSDVDGKSDLLKEYTTSGIEDAKVINRDVKNIKMDDSAGDDPVIITTNYKAASLIEDAGKNHLLNIGKIIGTQSQLYQKNERMNDVEMESPEQYYHHIYFKVPNGYKVKGLDDINIDKAYMVDGKRVCQFVSTYTFKDNVVDINVHEFYKNNHIPKDHYEEWRKVINAASDFNKLTLVLEKE